MQRDPNLRLGLKTGCRWGVKFRKPRYRGLHGMAVSGALWADGASLLTRGLSCQAHGCPEFPWGKV